MMTQFRKLSRVVLFAVVVAFAALMFFEWGMNATVSIKARDLDKGIIARVNDMPIYETEYRRLVTQAYQEREQYRGMTEEQIKAQVWQTIIEEKLWYDLIRREKISVTDDEIWAIIRNQPPPDLLQDPRLRDSTGAFDYRLYQQLLQNPQNMTWLLKYEQQIRTALPQQKVRMELMTTGWISPQEESLRLEMLTRLVSATFLTLGYGMVADAITVSDEMLRDYYQQHLADFEVPEQRAFRFVYFSREASGEDTANTLTQVDEIRDLLREDRDFLEIANDYADNSDIVVKVTNEKELPLELLTAFKKLRDGQISEPIRTPRGYTIIKRLNKSELQKVELTIEVSLSTIGAIKDLIDAFTQEAAATDFETAAKNHNLVARPTGLVFKDRLYFAGLENPGQLLDFGFSAKVRTTSPPMAGVSGYFVFILDTIVPKHTPDFETSKDNIRAILLAQNQPAEALRLARTLLAKQGSLEAVAQADPRFTLERIRLTDYEQLRANYPQELVGALYSLVPQQVKAVAADAAVYIVRCDSLRVVPFDSTKVAVISQDQETKVRTVYQRLFGEPKIVDHRDAFYD